MIGDTIFFAAFAGVLITELGVCALSRRKTSRNLPMVVLRAVCAGYVALCVLSLSRVDLAFATGLTFDLVIGTISKTGIQIVTKEGVNRDID